MLQETGAGEVQYMDYPAPVETPTLDSSAASSQFALPPEVANMIANMAAETQLKSSDAVPTNLDLQDPSVQSMVASLMVCFSSP